MALKQVKNKIVSTQKTGKVTKAMESVSAVKMRKSQQRAFAGRPYVHAALRILSRLSDSQDGLNHPLAQVRAEGKQLLVIVTSDKGLAGAVNSSVLKRAMQAFENNSDTDVVAIGRKALEFAKREGKEVVSEYTNVSDEVTLEDIQSITSTIMDSYTSGTYSNVAVIYQNFLSTFEQEPVRGEILPLKTEEIVKVMGGIKPKTGKFSDNTSEQDGKIIYTVEPSAEEVLNTLIPQLVQIMLYHALLESKASEHSSRMVAMKNATDKSKEVVKALTLVYNKQRQAAITAEVSEISGGIEAMK
ncbi:MAG: F-type H+-transporting ATPase subunit gamma [Patiriisocius sp.]|jgi:F-type H+-transporting ATPase subunit gamma